MTPVRSLPYLREVLNLPLSGEEYCAAPMALCNVPGIMTVHTVSHLASLADPLRDFMSDAVELVLPLS
jgi:hypothetical protein